MKPVILLEQAMRFINLSLSLFAKYGQKDSGEHDSVTGWLERRRNSCPMYKQDLEIRMEIS